MSEELEAPGTDLSVTIREPVTEMLRVIGGSPPGREAGSLIGDIIRGRRARTQVKVLERTFKAIEAADLPVHVVPDKTLVPLLEFAGLEDEQDDDMIDRWAHLLATAATMSGRMPASFPEILRQLEPVEARAMEYLVPVGTYELPDPEPTGGVLMATGLGDADLGNLERLGLVTFYAVGSPTWDDLMHLPSALRQRVGASALGVDFVTACRFPRPPQAAD